MELIWLEHKETFVLSFEESLMMNEEVAEAKVDRLRAELVSRGYCFTQDEFAIASKHQMECKISIQLGA